MDKKLYFFPVNLGISAYLLCFPLTNPAAFPVFILPSHCCVGFFNGKQSGILVYFNSDKGNLFCHVICDNSEIKVDVVIYRGQLHFATCTGSPVLLMFTSQLQRHMLMVILWIHRLTSDAMVSLKPTNTLLKGLLWPRYHVK